MAGVSLWCTRASIHACNHSGHHLVSLEGGTALFDAILAPMCSGNCLVTCGSMPHTINLANDNQFVWKIAKCSRISKSAIA